MNKSTWKIFVFRVIMFMMVVVCVEAIGYIGLWYNSRGNDHFSNKNYFHIRAMLMGSKNPEMFPRYLSLPNMGYIPYPGYTQDGILQHNEDGYRGKKVPLRKSNSYRILCMGGSTTYGSGVNNPSDAYPAQLEQLLNDYFSKDDLFKLKYTNIEVINAGLEAGNSSDELRQYVFKYKYYKPDLVIMHSGINDALTTANTQSDFQLDYTHSKRLNFHLDPLNAPASWMMRSYFFSFISIRLFYEKFSITKSELDYSDGHQFATWSDVDMNDIIKNKQYDFYPFYVNTKNLYQTIRGDSVALMVLPNILNIDNELVKNNPPYQRFSQLNDSLSLIIAKEVGATYVPFNFENISKKESWLDDCHLDKVGEREKALVIFPHVVKQIDYTIQK